MALEIKNTHDKSKSKKTKSRKNSNNRIHFILDESGSMSSCWHSTIDGFNEYINGLKNDKNGNKYKISLTKFEGGNIVNVYEDVRIKDVEPLTIDTYIPCGGTNLNDAIGTTMTNMKKNAPRRKHNTLIIIMTDGWENMSREWTADGVAKLVKEQEDKHGWTITFLGANIDTAKVGRTYAIKESNTKSYSTHNMAATMRGLSQATAVYASTATVGASSSDFFSGTSDWTKTEDENDKVQLSDSLNLSVSDVGSFIQSADLAGGEEDLLDEAEKALKRMEGKTNV